MNTLFEKFDQISKSPAAQLSAYKAQGKKAIGVLPSSEPEELVYAAGIVPFGMWGSN